MHRLRFVESPQAIQRKEPLETLELGCPKELVRVSTAAQESKKPLKELSYNLVLKISSKLTR